MNQRNGFTLVELLVVVAIIGVLVALLLPAVQAAREAARRAQCQSHLKQLALAVHAYHDVHGQVPSLYNGSAPPTFTPSLGLQMHSWRTSILPFVEQQSLYDQLDFEELATDALNQPAITAAVEVFTCPSTPRESMVARGLWVGRGRFEDLLSAAVTDYNASEGIAQEFECIDGGWAESGDGSPSLQSVAPPVSFERFTDGLSNTFLIIERGGLPDHYYLDRFEPHQPPRFRTWGNVGLWAISAEMLLNHIHIRENIPLVNGDNQKGIYSFHPGGAVVAYADGSVHYLSEDVPDEVILAAVTPNGGEIVDVETLR